MTKFGVVSLVWLALLGSVAFGSLLPSDHDLATLAMLTKALPSTRAPSAPTNPHSVADSLHDWALGNPFSALHLFTVLSANESAVSPVVLDEIKVVAEDTVEDWQVPVMAPGDLKVLFDLYEVGGGKNWSISKTGWLSNNDTACSWTGVKCNENGSIAILNMFRFGLTALPESIGDLSGLVELVVSYNSLNKLPPTIGRLSKLAKFSATSNNLRSLPDEIGDLTAMKRLR